MQGMAESSFTPTNSKSIQVPFFFVSSILDPHCQLIELPTEGQSEQLVSVARWVCRLNLRLVVCGCTP